MLLWLEPERHCGWKHCALYWTGFFCAEALSVMLAACSMLFGARAVSWGFGCGFATISGTP